jgi:hypothetical protein
MTIFKLRLLSNHLTITEWWRIVSVQIQMMHEWLFYTEMTTQSKAVFYETHRDTHKIKDLKEPQ